ncbi:protein FAM234A isoform X2 [Nannospalax galili]|uniref:protein FAM234A isoform X2 n=1 Tax=Nannospalax galili TaxID=1026970 RepID=UPI0004ED43EA|nr:protein FAM234A isoform X2 [Nannospalax galili]
MMDNKDLEAEIHPLKNEERKSQENVGKQLKTEDNLKSRTPQSRLSRCRTVAFFLSLFVCLFVVFVVSFLIPCPERPLSERMWRIDYNASVTYDFLAMEDVNKDRIQDVLFLYKNTYNSNNYTRSCADEGFSTPCAFVAAVSGANGSVLWERPVAQDVALVECAMPHSDSETSACILVGRLGSFIAVNSFTASSLCSCSVKVLYEKMTGKDGPFKKDSFWENIFNTSTYGICSNLHLQSSGAVRYLMNVPGKAGEDVLLVSSDTCTLLDGQDLTPKWTLGATQILRKPFLGHYKPDTLAVVIENGTSTDRQILLLDLSTGAVLWNQPLPSLPGSPSSTSLPTADHRSAFFFWGLHELVSTNEMEPRDVQHSLYMFHPTLPGILLELANVSANIVAFDVILFEPSRHAAYVLLTGPASSDVPGLVSVTKHKVRDLVLDSRVVHLGEGSSDSDQAIRDRFSRLRYRS